MTANTFHLARAIVWRNLWLPGTEYAALWRSNDGWSMQGTVTCSLDDRRPMLVNYAVFCDPQWRTRRAEVERTIGNDIRHLVLEATGAGEWQVAGEPVAMISGCIDVDLSISPITNSLPIPRLNLEVGARAAVAAAWVRFPPEVSDAMLKAAREKDTRRCLLLLGTILDTP